MRRWIWWTVYWKRGRRGRGHCGDRGRRRETGSVSAMMSVEGSDIKKSSIRRMSCRDERRRHVRRLPHVFWVCLCWILFLLLVEQSEGVRKRIVAKERTLLSLRAGSMRWSGWSFLWCVSDCSGSEGLGSLWWGSSEAEYLSKLEPLTLTWAFLRWLSLDCDVLMLIQTILFHRQQRTNPLTTHSFHSPTAPAPLSSISFTSPLAFYPRIIFIHHTSSLHTRSFRTAQVPSYDRISHPIIPTLHHHDSISD